MACSKRVRARSLSGWPLMVIYEPPDIINVGAVGWEKYRVSDRERALLDVAGKPNTIGGIPLLAEAVALSGGRADAAKIMRHADSAGRHAPLRRIGSVADALGIDGLAGELRPLRTPSSDLNLDPSDSKHVWRDPRWRVRWPMSIDELLAVTEC